MNNEKKRRLGLAGFIFLLISSLVLLISCGGGGDASAPRDSYGFIMVNEIPAAAGLTLKSADEFWTRERVQKALENPLDQIIDLSAEPIAASPEQGNALLRSSASASKNSEPFNPDGNRRGFSIGQLKAARQKATASSAAAETLPPCPASDYETGYAPRYDLYPERTQGVLVFGMGNNKVGSCSASLVGSNLIMTAAHCVADRGRWYEDWGFVPGFNGSANWKPYGIGSAQYVFIFSGWFDDRNFAADVAFIALNEQLGNRIGWLGTGFDQPRGQQWLQVGYPQDYPYDGVTLAYNLSAFGYNCCAAGSACEVPEIAVGSAFTQGSSGGPWLVTRDNNYYVNGLNSYGPGGCSHLTMVSPYFGNRIGDLYEAAAKYR